MFIIRKTILCMQTYTTLVQKETELFRFSANQQRERGSTTVRPLASDFDNKLPSDRYLYEH
jgi:hypothetical protein